METATYPDDHFYSALPAQKMPMHELLVRNDLFSSVPDTWHVVITDVVNSTESVFGGRHEDINLIATGSIVSVLNIAYSLNITVPFFFGGDGATFIVPHSLMYRVMKALTLYKANIMENFGLELRTGDVPITNVYAAGHAISIAKYSRSKAFDIPVVLGEGLAYAEKLVKGEDFLLSPIKDDEGELDLTGMQCRWDKIPPPKNKEEVVTLLVIARSAALQAPTFKKVMEKIDELYGAPDKRQPISVPKLKLKSTFAQLGKEMRAGIGRIEWFELLKNWFRMLLGPIYFSTRKGRKYLRSLVEMSDTLVIDGKINTVMSGSVRQRAALQELLDTMEGDGEILYGLHVSTASIMSCYVRNLEDDHIHFVDGSEGGYTMAARTLKAKYAGIEES